MAKTDNLGLPLVMPAQAQKHVTVNEALALLDAAAQLRVFSSSLPTPPGTDIDGRSYLVPSGANGEWQGRAGQIAVRSNGGWVYLSPKAGWRAWDESRNGTHMFDGSAWVTDALAVSPNGAGICWKVAEFDHVIAGGSNNSTTFQIPGQAQVVGVTGRVIEALSGSGLTGWRIGIAGSDNRYGAGIGTARNSYLVGLSGAPVTYYAPTPLLLSAEGGSFAAGTIRLAVSFAQILPPRAV